MKHKEGESEEEKDDATSDEEEKRTSKNRQMCLFAKLLLRPIRLLSPSLSWMKASELQNALA